MTAIDQVVLCYVVLALGIGVLIGMVAAKSYRCAAKDPDWDGGM